MAASASVPSFHDVVGLHAAIDGDLLLLKAMAASEVNLHEAKDEKGQGVLLLAAVNGHLEVCRFLVDELGLDCNCMSAGVAPVHVAAGHGHESVLRYLLDRGGDPGMLDSEGTSLLHFAVMGGDCQVVRLVLSKGVDVDPPDYLGLGTPLLFAAFNARVEVIKILLEHGADPNKVVAHVYSPLMAACFVHSLESMKLLVKAGADVNFVAPSGRCILTEATDAGLIDIVKFLLEAGADPNLADKDGKSQSCMQQSMGKASLLKFCFLRQNQFHLFQTGVLMGLLEVRSVDGIIRSAKDLLLFNAHDAAMMEERIADARSQGKEAFAKGEYTTEVYFYCLAMEKDSSDATLFANRSLCWLQLRDGDEALSDARRCILMRPHWWKALYRLGAALSSLKILAGRWKPHQILSCNLIQSLHLYAQDYKAAMVAFEQALILDPASDEIKKALREAFAGIEGAAASMDQGHP